MAKDDRNCNVWTMPPEGTISLDQILSPWQSVPIDKVGSKILKCHKRSTLFRSFTENYILVKNYMQKEIRGSIILTRSHIFIKCKTSCSCRNRYSICFQFWCIINQTKVDNILTTANGFKVITDISYRTVDLIIAPLIHQCFNSKIYITKSFQKPYI